MLGLSLYLHSYVVYKGSEGPGESAYMRRLALALAVRPCDKYCNIRALTYLKMYDVLKQTITKSRNAIYM